MNADVAQHCAEINRCNQRGRRMLSIVDLLDAGTMSSEVAAYLLAAISGGASFMTGALPGGAGKTTIMCALLNFVPQDVVLAPADGREAILRGVEIRDRRMCYICHEISDGPYYAYLWDRDLREFFGLKRAGHMLATNLHADTFDQARRQVCVDNGVAAGDFLGMNIIIFIAVNRLRGRTDRVVREIWESDGKQDHRRIFSLEQALPHEASRVIEAGDYALACDRLDSLIRSQVRTIEDVRGHLAQLWRIG